MILESLVVVGLVVDVIVVDCLEEGRVVDLE